MKIISARIVNYKSFSDTDWVDLSNGFNVLVGQNSSGKSAFLAPFQFQQFTDKPHRDPRRAEGSALPNKSALHLRVSVDGPEFKDESLKQGEVWLPTSQVTGTAVPARYFEQRNSFEVTFLPGIATTMPGDHGHGVIASSEMIQGVSAVRLLPTEDRRGFSAPQIYGNQNDSVPQIVDSLIRSTTFVFDAKRYNVGRKSPDGSAKLSPSAENLPNMLLSLNRDYKRMEQYQNLVREILPFVRRVIVSSIGQEIEISIQSDPSFRADLAIPLDECGTGVSQIVAIVYVLVAYRSAQILIDEPSSFLHPGATRRLIQVMKRFPAHQFLVTTHAADVIAAVRPERLLAFRWDEPSGETIVTVDDGNKVEHLRSSLAELGASMSDVFGYDVVVFVEGPTEAACFPLLVPNDVGLAVNFIPMREASRFGSKGSGKAEAIFDVYRSGVQASGMLAPRTRFSFDADLWTEKEVADLRRKGKDEINFLSVPMYESYLLVPEAISALLASLENGILVAPGALQTWLTEHQANFPVIDHSKTPTDKVDAASLLSALVSEFTEARWEYSKIEHGRYLTVWLLDHQPGALAEAVKYVRTLVR